MSWGKIKSKRYSKTFLFYFVTAGIALMVFAGCSVSRQSVDRGYTDSLISQLNDTNPEVRKSAARKLGELKNQEAVKYLVKIFKGKDYSVSETSREALFRIGGKEVLAEMINLLQDNNASEHAHQEALWVLRHINNAQAVKAVINTALYHENHFVREYAIDYLVEVNSRSATKSLIKALSHENVKIRAHAAHALRLLKDEAIIKPLFNAFLEAGTSFYDQFLIVDAMQGLKNLSGSDHALDYLLARMDDRDSRKRELAVKILVDSKSPEVIQKLNKALNDESARVRMDAAEALAKESPSQAIETLISCLNNQDHEIRGAAASALGRVKSLHAVDSLAKALKDDDYDVRRDAVHALYEINDPRAIEALIEVVNDKTSTIRQKALESLVRFKTYNTILQAARDEDSNIREIAVTALAYYDTPEAFSYVIEALSDKSANVRLKTLLILSNKKERKAFEFIKKLLYDDDSKIRGHAANALRSLANTGEDVETLIKAAEIEIKQKEKEAETSNPQFDIDKGTEKLNNREISLHRGENKVALSVSNITGSMGPISIKIRLKKAVEWIKVRPEEGLIVDVQPGEEKKFSFTLTTIDEAIPEKEDVTGEVIFVYESMTEAVLDSVRERSYLIRLKKNTTSP
ncbi:MAG: HEAT repeat domain-containing protein [bacterium]